MIALKKLKSQIKWHDSWGQLCFKQIGTMSCCCHFLLLYFNIPFHSWTSSRIERATQTLTFSGVSPSHGSPSPNIRNISHLQDPQHILLHDVEVHDSRQWYPETMGHVCSDSLMHTTDELPSKASTKMERPPFLGALIPIESQRMGLPAMLVYQRVTKRQHLFNQPWRWHTSFVELEG